MKKILLSLLSLSPLVARAGDDSFIGFINWLIPAPGMCMFCLILSGLAATIAAEKKDEKKKRWFTRITIVLFIAWIYSKFIR